MTAVRMQGTFKKDSREFNGLEAIAEELMTQPTQRHMVVAEVESVGYEVNFADGGTRSPKIRWVSIEPLDGDAAMTARKLRDEAYHDRTGQTAPPPTLFDDGVVDVEVVDDEAVDPAEDEPWPGDADAGRR